MLPRFDVPRMQNAYTEGVRLICFGLVGVGATCIHIGVAYFTLPMADSLFFASGCGFIVALPCSWFGHRALTFRDAAQRSWARFCTVACGGFLGSLAVLIFLEPALPHMALFISILVIPGISYVLSRAWVFRRV